MYARNSKVQEMFGIDFIYDSRDGAGTSYSSWINTLNSSILANDGAYQMAGGYGYRLAADTLNESYMNLSNNPYIDFSREWWPSNILEAADVGSRMNICFGNLYPSYYDTTYAFYFNKKIAEDIGAGDLYALVNDGKWTLDKMFDLAISAARDIDGDTKIGKGDIYGYISNDGMCISGFLQSCDIHITEKDSDGMPSLIGLTERYADTAQKLRDFKNNSGVAWIAGWHDEEQDAIFASGEALFYPNSFSTAHKMRDMADDFGILPYPKFDEKQDKYITYNAIGNSTAFVAPITSDETLVGCVLDALAYYGWKDILPEYYERALKGKTARDNESEAMLDIIFNNIEYDFTQIYALNFGDQKSPAALLESTLRDNKDISSLWARDENIYKKTINKLIEDLK